MIDHRDMAKSLRLFLLAGALVLAATAMLDARLMRSWSYQELLDQSDLVVIAAPTGTSDTPEQIDLPGIAVAGADNQPRGLPVIGVETRFRVSAVLKGGKALTQFVLHHYREARPEAVSSNGPALVAFDPVKTGSFLLFLVREADGRYAPTSGQTDPGFFAVHPLGGIAQ